jgi:hypothetical protein
MKNAIVFFSIIGIALFSISSKVFDKKHVRKDILRFIESKNYTYSKRKKDIPDHVLKGIKEFENGNFNPGDIGDSGKISMGCEMHPDGFDGLLNFVMVNDSSCILSYSHGGQRKYNTVYFIEYKPTFHLAKDNDLGYWTDTGSRAFRRALYRHPRPDIVWSRVD